MSAAQTEVEIKEQPQGNMKGFLSDLLAEAPPAIINEFLSTEIKR